MSGVTIGADFTGLAADGAGCAVRGLILSTDDAERSPVCVAATAEEAVVEGGAAGLSSA